MPRRTGYLPGPGTGNADYKIMPKHEGNLEREQEAPVDLGFANTIAVWLMFIIRAVPGNTHLLG